MRKKSLFHRFTLGLLVGALIMPAQPARAQFGGIVFDAKNFAENVRKRIEDAKKHAEIFDNAVKQYTTLRGVLGKVDDLVAKQNNAIVTMANIGRTVRASLQLKDQVQAIIQTRLTMLKSIDDRLRRGILDPEADMRDLEDYLRVSIGRSSQDSLANLERLQRMDNILENLIYEWKKAEAALASERDEKSGFEDIIDKITKKQIQESETVSIPSLKSQIAKCETLITQHEKHIEELKARIKERMDKYHGVMDERIQFAERVSSTNKAWSGFNDKLREIQKSLLGL
jgi:hypothetical protein